MAKNYLLEYSERLATDIEMLCRNVKAQVAFMPIYGKQITGKANRICFLNLKLQQKNVMKQRVG